jgi:hypothetical protein
MTTQLFIFLVFGGAGLALLYVGATQWRLQHRLLSHARPVAARILESEVHTVPAADEDDYPSHHPEIRFRYQIDGRTHESDRLRPSIIGHGDGSAEDVAALLRPFPKGASVVAYVDPQHPTHGFLIPQASPGPAVFTALGLLLPPLAWLVGGVV